MKKVETEILKTVPIISQGLEVMGTISPNLSFVVSGVCGIISLWGNLAKEKGEDFMQQFIDNEDKIKEEIIKSEKFCSVFLEVFDKNIKESNEEKRKLLKNYILNFACGIEKDFNEHTKLINVLNDITMEEFNFLQLWNETNPCTILNVGGYYSYTVSEIESILRAKCKYHPFLQKNYIKDKNKCNQILISLGNKGLLYVLSKDNFGSGEEARANKDITEFGKIFLNFIKEV